MAKLVVNSESLVSVADAIREKGGTTEELTFPQGFVDAVGAIKSGGGTMDAFWDAFQQKGARTSYNDVFSYNYVTNETFYPKYDIIPKSGNLFRQSSNLTIDLIERLKECGVTLDTSSLGNANYIFEACGVTTIPTISFASIPSGNGYLKYVFSCPNLITIEKLIVHRGLQLDNCLHSCPKLQNIVIEGEVDKNFNIKLSPLTANSVKSIIDALVTVETAQTLTLHPNVKILQSQVDSANAKGWTVAGGTVVSEEEYYG